MFVNITIRAVNCLQLLSERFSTTSYVLADQRKLHAGMPISLQSIKTDREDGDAIDADSSDDEENDANNLKNIFLFLTLLMLRTMMKISNMTDSSRSVVVWLFSRRQIVNLASMVI